MAKQNALPRAAPGSVEVISLSGMAGTANTWHAARGPPYRDDARQPLRLGPGRDLPFGERPGRCSAIAIAGDAMVTNLRHLFRPGQLGALVGSPPSGRPA